MAETDMRGLTRQGDMIVIICTLVAGAALLAASLMPWVTVIFPGGREVPLGHESIPQVGGEVDPQAPSIIVLVCAALGLAAAAAGLLIDRRITVVAGVTGLAATATAGYFGFRVQQIQPNISTGEDGFGDLLDGLLERVMPQITLAPGWYATLIMAVAMTAAGVIAAIIGGRDPAPPYSPQTPPAQPYSPTAPQPPPPGSAADTRPHFYPPEQPSRRPDEWG